jgi:hypothetical protein
MYLGVCFEFPQCTFLTGTRASRQDRLRPRPPETPTQVASSPIHEDHHICKLSEVTRLHSPSDSQREMDCTLSEIFSILAGNERRHTAASIDLFPSGSIRQAFVLRSSNSSNPYSCGRSLSSGIGWTEWQIMHSSLHPYACVLCCNIPGLEVIK